jgi:tRNA wybutosine-synthesizing protein 1
MREYIIPGKIDEPKDIIDGLFEERRKLLIGFGGLDKVDKKVFEESLIPSHVAISLAGEPTIYPKLVGMIQYLNSKPEIKSIFIVTNGLEPGRLKELSDKKALPTQLYLSIEASNKELHLEINKPKTKDSWEKLAQTIELYPSLNCRKIVRFTLIKDINDSDEYINDFIKMFEKSDTDFLEIKAYMFLGESRQRLKYENMPTHEFVREYSKKIEAKSELFSIINEQIESRIVLLKNKNSKVKNFIK